MHSDYNGVYIFANSNTAKVTKTSTWGTSYNTSVTTTLSSTGSITLGLKFTSTPSTSSEINIYADNFNIVFSGPASIQINESSDNGNLLSIFSGTMADATVVRNVKAGYNTLVLPFSMTNAEVKMAFGANAKVYQLASFEGTYVTFSLSNGITANTPCLLYADNSTSYFTLYGKSINYNAVPTVSQGGLTMTGTYAANSTVPIGAYVLSNGTLYPTPSEVSMKALRAYFKVDSDVKSINIRFEDDATDIQELVMTQNNHSECYFDLSGRRVLNPKHGIYIYKGKKIVIRQ